MASIVGTMLAYSFTLKELGVEQGQICPGYRRGQEEQI
jgi:hypothetical protein